MTAAPKPPSDETTRSFPAEGEMARPFAVTRDDGATVSLSDFAGRGLVIFFFPKADTSGCTTEAKDFEGSRADFEAEGVSVLGMSPDAPAVLAKWKAKAGLNLALGADPNHVALRDYGVWVSKSMYGRSYMGVARSTLLVDRSGRVARAWPKVSVPGHVAEVLAAARALPRA